MKTNYTTKDIQKIMNMSKETLRYYVNQGLIHPYIKNENNYRYFSDIDIGKLFQSKKLRSLEYSVNQIKDTVKSESLSEYYQTFKNKQTYYEQQALHYQNLSLRNKEWIIVLEKSLNNYGNIQNDQMNEVYFIYSYKDRESYDNNSQKYCDFSRMKKEDYIYFDYALIVSKEDFKAKKPNYSGGTFISKRWLDYVNIDKSITRKIFYPKVLSLVIESNNMQIFNDNLYQLIDDYCIKHNYFINNDLFIEVIASYANKNVLKVWIPYENMNTIQL